MDASAVTVFDPAQDSLAFRSGLGQFATGVTVVTTTTPEGPVGITANSFSGISLDPPLVMWSPDKGSRRYEHFADAQRFAIHVLSAEQRDLCVGFMRSKTAFEPGTWHPSHAGVPLLDGALAIYECNFEARHDAGDHALVLGRVTRVHRRDGAPLVFHGGEYGSFAPGG